MSSTLYRELLPVPERGNRKQKNPVHVAVVSSADGILETVVKRDATQMWSRLGEYVRENACNKLWPEDARLALEKLDGGRVEAAVELYFNRVGQRWDRETLRLDVVELV